MKERLLTKAMRLLVSLLVVVLTAIVGYALWRPETAAKGGPVWEAVRVLPAAEPFMVNINTATERELEELPGIGAELAKRIIQERQTGGPFETADDLQRVKGIGENTMSNIAEYITTR